jgi:hypothetical protein
VEIAGDRRASPEVANVSLTERHLPSTVQYLCCKIKSSEILDQRDRTVTSLHRGMRRRGASRRS